MNKWRRFRRLSAPERGILLQALLLLPLTAFAFYTVGFRRWKSFLTTFTGRENSTSPVTPESLQCARRAAQMVEAAAREGIVHAKCLERSIVLWWLLLRKRIPAEMRIGARQSVDGFEAHAWVEVQGRIVNDEENVRHDYVPFGNEISKVGVKSH